MNGWYFLCPECGKLSKGGDWEEKYTNYMRGTVHLIEAKEGVFLDYTDEEIEDTERYLTKHECGFTTEDWDTEDFAVYIEGKKITDSGIYWEYHMEDLKEIAKKLGLEVEIEENDEE